MGITVRTRKLTKGRSSVYLDFYPPILNPETGKETRRENLKNFFVYDKPKNSQERKHNKETNQKAEIIRSQRALKIQGDDYDFLRKKTKNGNFVDFVEALIKKREASGKNYDTWKSMYMYLSKFSNGHLPFKKLDKNGITGFREYLLNTTTLRSKTKKLHQNSASGYFNVFREAVTAAVNDGKITGNPLSQVKTIPQLETQRAFLTLEEFRLLIKMPCGDTLLKNAFLFACLTGLRKSDILSLTWHEIQYSELEGYIIQFRQKKTDIPQRLNIPKDAINYIGERQADDVLVFDGLQASKFYTLLPKWVNSAGISKHITFHCARHTCATLHLTFDTDIYIIKELLGHKSVQTTQIYAKVVSRKKREAVNRMSDKLKIS